MTSLQKVAAVVDVLNAHRVPYMLTGSLASNLYGIPRSTQDADFVVQLDAAGITRVASSLRPLFTLDPQSSFETVTMTSRYVLLSEDRELKIELFLLGDDLYDRERFRRRREGILEGRVVYVPSPEDVIVTKLLWYKRARRAKDLADVRNVLFVQGARLDEAYLHDWCDRHGARELLETIRHELSEARDRTARGDTTS